MSQLKKLIDNLTVFGTNPNVVSDDKVQDLKKLLIGIYTEFLNVKSEFDETDYEEEPEFDYKEIRQNVESNFPDFGWYGCIMDSTIIVPEVKDIGTGDAIDDLTDIIKDLLAVKWNMENTSKIDAIWNFEIKK